MGGADATMLTNVFTERPARTLANRLTREVGPISGAVPGFPVPMAALAPLRAAAEQKQRSSDFSPLWMGQEASLAQEMPGEALTRALAEMALERVRRPFLVDRPPASRS